MTSPTIHQELSVHHDGIYAVHAAAFPTDDEARLVNQLRDEGSLRISLIAMIDDLIVGHVALSQMQAPHRTLGLAPVATLPGFERRGIAAALIKAALAQAGQENWDAVFVLGDPAYYGRFGFDVARADQFDSPYQGPSFAVCPLVENWPLNSGPATYAPAFAAL